VIVTAIERAANGEAIVTVMPVTHREPDDAAKAVEIPLVTAARAGRCAVVNVNHFIWPDYDLRPIARGKPGVFAGLPSSRSGRRGPSRAATPQPHTAGTRQIMRHVTKRT
jgi:hypothetical protein